MQHPIIIYLQYPQQILKQYQSCFQWHWLQYFQLLYFMNSSLEDKLDGQKGFTFTEYLNKRQKAEMKLLQQFRYKFPKEQSKRQIQSSFSELRLPFRQRTMHPNIQQSQTDQKQQIIQVNENIVIINNKLIYLKEQQKDVKNDRKRLIKLIKQNKINYKKFMLGNKQKYLDMIVKHEKEKEEKVLNQYVKRYIHMEKTTKIQVCHDFQDIKDSLFSSKE